MCGNDTSVSLMRCDMQSLQAFLADNHADCSLTACYKGVWVEDIVDEEAFREAMEGFVCACNRDRQTVEGYELCYDVEPENGQVTFYVMREDGKTMLEVSVLFIDPDLVQGLFRQEGQKS